MNILLIGDVHGDMLRLHRKLSVAVERYDVEAAIQVGDFGFFPRILGRLQLIGLRMPVPTYAVDGNHEDHDWLFEYENEEKFAKHNIYYMPRGSTKEIADVAFGFIGGALHADRPQESHNAVSKANLTRAACAFNTFNVKVAVSHSCPHSIGVNQRGHPAFRASVDKHIRQAGFDPGPDHDCGEPGLTELYHRLARKPRLWFYGHFHEVCMSTVGDTDFICCGTVGDDQLIVLDTDGLGVRVHRPSQRTGS